MWMSYVHTHTHTHTHSHTHTRTHTHTHTHTHRGLTWYQNTHTKRMKIVPSEHYLHPLSLSLPPPFTMFFLLMHCNYQSRLTGGNLHVQMQFWVYLDSFCKAHQQAWSQSVAWGKQASDNRLQMQWVFKFWWDMFFTLVDSQMVSSWALHLPTPFPTLLCKSQSGVLWM